MVSSKSRLNTRNRLKIVSICVCCCTVEKCTLVQNNGGGTFVAFLIALILYNGYIRFP